MNFYQINWQIPITSESHKDIAEFVTKLARNKIHYFLYLKIEIKYTFIEITGYSLHSLSDINNPCLLSVYINNSLDIFINIIFNNYINGIENNYKVIFYINCFWRFMSTYL